MTKNEIDDTLIPLTNIHIRNLMATVYRHTFGIGYLGYAIEIKLLPGDFFSQEEPQSLILDYRNLLRLEEAVQRATAAIERDRAEKPAAVADQVNDPETFGACPHCGKNDGYFNIHRAHWFVCHEHHVRWLHGENLFSSWRHETEADWQQNFELIGSYSVVTSE